MTVVAAREHVRKVTVEHADDRGTQQEVAVLRRHRGHDLRQQVIADRAIVAREVGNEARRVGMVTERDRGEADRADPTLGVRPQATDIVVLDRDAERAHHLDGLGEREGKVGRADLGELILQAQSPEVQRWVGPAGHDQPQPGQRMSQQQLEVGVDRAGDLVEVVEHEHHRGAVGGQRRGQRGNEYLDAVAGRRAHPADLPAAGAMQRLEHRPPEPPVLAVGRVERQPRDRPLRPCRDPAPEQYRLARAGRRSQQRQRALDSAIEVVEQPLAAHEPVLHGRQGELGGKQRTGVCSCGDGAASRGCRPRRVRRTNTVSHHPRRVMRPRARFTLYG